MPSTPDELLTLVRDELALRNEQGCDTWELERQAKLIKSEDPSDKIGRLEALYRSICKLEPSPDFPYEEPGGIASIRKLRPQGPRRIAVAVKPQVMADKVLGAWQGRAAGCILGKPVEGWSAQKIGDLMAACNMAELHDYWPAGAAKQMELHPGSQRCLAGNITRAVQDDDLDYTVLGLGTLERYGLDFTAEQAAERWLKELPYHRVWSAGRCAYRNLVNGIRPPETATHRNPYRESLGATIRADVYGYARPGRPEHAAEMAFRDASISQVGNGIYAGMWVAAMLAAAFVAERVEKVVEIGLTEIPGDCRLAEAAGRVLQWRREGCAAAEARSRILADYGHYRGNHSINNGALVAMALLWGEKDFTRTIELAVCGGLDTDCNGATAGSICGAMVGAGNIPNHWTEPLDDRLDTALAGEACLTLSGLAERTLAVQQTES